MGLNNAEVTGNGIVEGQTESETFHIQYKNNHDISTLRYNCAIYVMSAMIQSGMAANRQMAQRAFEMAEHMLYFKEKYETQGEDK